MSVTRALLVDYGGVLTSPVGASFAAYERELGIAPGRSFELLLAASQTVGGGPIGALERGEMSTADFDAVLRTLLADAGEHVPAEGSLLAGYFARMLPAGALWDLVAAARDRGVRTGLLSNSWGTDLYPRDRLASHFDVTVISGEVGLRKPDPAIYLLACERIGVPPQRCAFVDDLVRNVEAAVSLGMFGVVHAGDDAATTARVAAFLELGTDGIAGADVSD